LIFYEIVQRSFSFTVQYKIEIYHRSHVYNKEFES
jgi:hypothetical protein